MKDPKFAKTQSMVTFQDSRSKALRRGARPASSIPTAGFPSQNAAIRALYDKGYGGKAISEMIGVSTNSVYRALVTHRKNLKEV